MKSMAQKKIKLIHQRNTVWKAHSPSLPSDPPPDPPPPRPPLRALVQCKHFLFFFPPRSFEKQLKKNEEWREMEKEKQLGQGVVLS